MNNESAFRITPRLIIGFGILALGMLWTLDNLDVLRSEPITRWWPVVLVLIGIVKLFDGHASRILGALLVVVGGLLLLDEARLLDFDLGTLFPLIIAVVGAKLIWEAMTRRRSRSGELTGDSDSVIHSFALMSGVKRQSTSTEFRGGDANAIMGGVELDLRNAQIRPGDDVVIDAFAMWGGIEIRVPAEWRVVGDVLPIMGAFQDNSHPSGVPGPTLTVRGTAIMGGIEVKN
jgi:predicted membrane protein